MPSYDKQFRSYNHWKLGKASVLDRSGYLVKFGVYAYFQWRTGGAMNTKVLDNFITFLTRGRTQNFDLERRNCDRLKLNDTISYDFSLRVNFKFLLVRFPKFILFMKRHMQHHDICWSYTFITKRKTLPNIYGVRIGNGSHTHPRSQFYRI
jgi:hypothetical protein